jgi:hypothetical protein
LGGFIPDLDVLAIATHGPFGEFLYHRGFTHALWFGMGEVTPRVLPTRNGFIVEIDDFRYGGLGQLDQGMWGIRAIYDGNGKPLGPARRFRRSPEAGLELLKALWQATWGDFSGVQALMGVASGEIQADSRVNRTAD